MSVHRRSPVDPVVVRDERETNNAVDLVPEVDSDLLRTVARSVPRVDSTTLPVEQANFVVELDALSRAVVERDCQVMAGECLDWSRVADRLAVLTRECRRRVVLAPCDVGDSGGR
jgi:hypothetical protein